MITKYKTSKAKANSSDKQSSGKSRFDQTKQANMKQDRKVSKQRNGSQQRNQLNSSFQRDKKVGYDKDEQAALHGKQFVVKCIGLDDEGRGIVVVNQRRILVPYLLEGEEALIEVSVHRGRIDGRVLEVKSSSEYRVKSKCRVFGVCGGCQFHHMTYEKQIMFKEELIRQQFAGLRIKHAQQIPMIASKHPLHYRHKNQMVFGLSKKKQIVSGFYEDNSHRIINYDDCLIQHPKANEITRTLKALLAKYKLMPYDEDTRTGLIRHIFIRYGYATNEILVAIVTASEVFPARKQVVSDLRQAHPEITTIVQSINDRNTNMVLGEKQRVLYGNGYIEDVLCGVRFQISPQSFYQINPVQTELLYHAAIEAANLTPNDEVLDTYCGIGTIGLIAAKRAKQVIGVELNKEAFQDAIRNAKLNQIKNAVFVNQDASQFMVNMAKQKEHVDVVFMDPPRSGSDERFIESLSILKPKKVIYVSCNVETQVRDIKQMMAIGYEVKTIQGVDLFPYTKHVETVVLMSRVGK